ncbi:hypothetical protein [uncultured Methylobacterium sp.]|uniref:hypothetical protein n=1 Tax=uncultured Methylobacterium sp. TaxID=157278 RepID=UPI0035CC5D58
MCSALALGAIAVTLSATPVPTPMCPRLDRMAPLMAALVGDARVQPAATDPQFEAAIRAIHAPAPKPTKRRHRR